MTVSNITHELVIKKYATERMIDSVWTLCYSIVEGGIFVHTYDRENAIGYQQEKSLDKCRMIEDNNRILQSVTIRNLLGASVTHDVVNKSYIFSYKDKVNS